MSRGSSRSLALVLALAIVGGGGFAAYRLLARRGTTTIALVDQGDPLRAIFIRRAQKREKSGARGALPEWPLAISVEDANLLWSIDSRYQYDAYCYYRYRGGLDLGIGAFRLHTSADGFREDFERLPEHVDDLVLVTGDSHTDGLCVNAESFANVCEERLARSTGRKLEVLNAGVSGYGFYNYAGVLERFAHLHPRAFVVAFYQGNDFVDCSYVAHFAHYTVPPPRSVEMWKQMRHAADGDQAVLGNALNQLAWFHANPDQEDFMRRAILEVVDRIHARCAEFGARAIFVHVPECMEIDPRWRDVVGRARIDLGLQDADFARIQRFSDDVLARVRANGDEALDLRAQLLADTASNYHGDLHISPAGHRVIADALTPLLERAIANVRNQR
jgi:lysophospholipase L1-like esterase